MNHRIWELDALRGLCILGMVLVHLVFDLVELYRLVQWDYPPWFTLAMDWGGILFLLICGISATLGSRPFRRGAMVFSCGMLCTAVTLALYRLQLADSSVIIWFGVLHCLGVCSMLWLLLRRLPTWLLAVLGGLLAVAGLGLDALGLRSGIFWLLPLGIPWPGFASADYFPLLPNLGFFLLGTVLGRLLYPTRKSLLPNVDPQILPLRFLRGCGRHSLAIYLLHQPVISGLLMLV